MSNKTQTQVQSHRAAMKMVDEAKKFHQSDIERTKKVAKIAWYVAGGAMVLTGLAVGAVLGLTPLKTVQPFVIRVDNNTGATDIVTTMKKQEKSYGEVMDKFWLGQYVRYREGYDWQTVQDTFDATNLLSSPQDQAQFSQIYKDNPQAPHKILRDTSKVVVRVNAIAFVGNMAQVRFEKAVIPLNKSDMQPEPQRYIATIAYEYKNAGMKDEDRLINPLGFQVTSYRVDKEHIQ